MLASLEQKPEREGNKEVATESEVRLLLLLCRRCCPVLLRSSVGVVSSFGRSGLCFSLFFRLFFSLSLVFFRYLLAFGRTRLREILNDFVCTYVR